MKKYFYLINLFLLTSFLFVASPSFGSSDDFTITPSLHNFFGINVGSDSGSQLLTFYNNSDSVIDVDTVILEGSNYGEFFISDDSLSGQNILPSSSASLEVTFSPTSEGCKHAYLKITVNGTESETVFVYFQGTGLKAGSIYLPTYDTPFNITYPGSETWYAVNLVKGESLSMVLNAHLVTGYLDYGFYDACGHELTGSNDNRIYNGEFGYANYSAKVSGVNYIRVWGSGDAVGNYDLGVYNAWSNVGIIDSDRTFRSSLNTAHFIANTNFVLDAHPNEYFRFVANAGEEVVISLTPHISVGNLDVNLLDLKGTVLRYSNDIGNGVNRTISRTVAVSGVYYVRVDRDSGAYGNYDLNISTGHEINADSDGDGASMMRQNIIMGLL